MFTFNEYADMYLIYGACNSNAAEAVRQYRLRFPDRNQPSRNTFRRLDQRVRETGRLVRNAALTGRPRSTRTPQVEVAVVEAVEHDPTRSVRDIAREVGIPSTIVHRILREENFHPYHYTKVQALEERDYQPRTDYCTWLLGQLTENPNFTRTVLFTDECLFTREGIFNSRNSHFWATENPHQMHARAFQRRFSVNVWAGVVGNHLIGPHVLPNRMNADDFLRFLQHDLDILLEDIPLATRQNMWLQLDGAPTHFAAVVRQWLHEHYPGRWIGRGGPVPWPPRSPDLTPLDFFLWGYMKIEVYKTPAESREDLINKINNAAAQVTPNMLERVLSNVQKRAEACINVAGEHFEHLL